MHHYGIPTKFVTLIQQMYENSTCQVIHNGKLSETFEVKTGVRQGCILSSLISLDNERLLNRAKIASSGHSLNS